MLLVCGLNCAYILIGGLVIASLSLLLGVVASSVLFLSVAKKFRSGPACIAKL